MGYSPRFISLSTEFAPERVAKTWLVVGEYRGSLDSWIREDIKLLRAWDEGLKIRVAGHWLGLHVYSCPWL